MLGEETSRRGVCVGTRGPRLGSLSSAFGARDSSRPRGNVCARGLWLALFLQRKRKMKASQAVLQFRDRALTGHQALDTENVPPAARTGAGCVGCDQT